MAGRMQGGQFLDTSKSDAPLFGPKGPTEHPTRSAKKNFLKISFDFFQVFFRISFSNFIIFHIKS